jgi:hypothetical protein
LELVTGDDYKIASSALSPSLPFSFSSTFSHFTPLSFAYTRPLLLPSQVLTMANTTRTSSSDIQESDRAVTTVVDEKLADPGRPEKSLVSASYNLQIGDEDPTDDELHGPNALRRVSAPIPWAVYTVAFVELCERFSYYGTQVLCMFLPRSTI